MNSENHQEIVLNNTMRKWEIDASLPPRFQEQVWDRIGRAAKGPEPFAWTALWDYLQALVPRPRFAYAYLTILLVSGVAAGSVAAQLKTTRLESNLSSRYVQSIDPYRAGGAQP